MGTISWGEGGSARRGGAFSERILRGQVAPGSKTVCVRLVVCPQAGGHNGDRPRGKEKERPNRNSKIGL
jgi:hypothetical protein